MDNIELLNILEYLPLKYVMMLTLFQPSIKKYIHTLYSVQFPTNQEFINCLKRSSSIFDLYLKYSKNIDGNYLECCILTAIANGNNDIAIFLLNI